MNNLPEWVENADDCPEDGCDGQVYATVAGTWSNPRAQLVSTCHHNPRRDVEVSA